MVMLFNYIKILYIQNIILGNYVWVLEMGLLILYIMDMEFLELELLIKIVTYILYSESYTGKFFSKGSNGKGIFLGKSDFIRR